MSFVVRYQLVDRRAAAGLLLALSRGETPDDIARSQPATQARWAGAREAWGAGDPAQAARAACLLVATYSAERLPAAHLRNIALTHRPARMPDAYRGLDLPGLDSPRRLFEAALGLDSPVLAHLPWRLDADDAPTGAYLDDPGQTGQRLASFLRDIRPDERWPLAPLAAALRAGERADLAVWELLDDGGSVEPPAGSPPSLHWPGLTRPALQAPLSASEWASVDGAWCRAAQGDLDDLVTLATWVDPADVERAALAQRALRQAFVRAGCQHLYLDDLLPRALDWLEATLRTPALLEEGARAHLQLMRCFLNDPGRRPLGDDIVARLATAPAPPVTDPELAASELRALLARHERQEPMAPAIVQGLADRWHALFLAAPALAQGSKLSDDVLADTTLAGRMLERLEGEPSPELAAMVAGLFAKAEDDDDAGSLFNRTMRARSAWIRALARVARSSEHARQLERVLDNREVQHIERLLDRSGPLADDVARDVADRWYGLHLARPERARRFHVGGDDPRPLAHLLHHLVEGYTPATALATGQLVVELLGRHDHEVETFDSAFSQEVRRQLGWLGALVSELRAQGHEELATRIAGRLVPPPINDTDE